MTSEAGHVSSTRRLELVTDPADELTVMLADGTRAEYVDGDLSASRRHFEQASRVAVGKAIRRALARITEADEALGGHLRRTVHTGVRCSYWPG